MNEYCSGKFNTSSTELLKLVDLKNKVSNKSYIEYIDIQINRLTNENAINSEIYLKLNNQTNSNQTINYSVSSNINYTDVINFTALVNKYKRDAESFLNSHTDMKDKFSELGIDEDFLYETEEINIQDKVL